MNRQIQHVIQLQIHLVASQTNDAIQLAKALKCSAFEIAGTADELVTLKNSQGCEIAAAADIGNEAGCSSWYVEGFVGDPCDVPLQSLIDTAHHQGVGRISFAAIDLSDSSGRRTTYANALNRLAGSLTKVLPHAERCGVQLCIRPAQGQLLTSPVELRELITNFNSPLLGVDLPTKLPEAVPGWTDWFQTLTPLIRSVRVQIDFSRADSAQLSVVQDVEREITKLCEPRTFEGDVVVCPKEA